MTILYAPSRDVDALMANFRSNVFHSLNIISFMHLKYSGVAFSQQNYEHGVYPGLVNRTPRYARFPGVLNEIGAGCLSSFLNDTA